MESLDPRIQRLSQHEYRIKENPEQFQTFEVFAQLKEGKPFFHTGIVHASDIDLAFLFAKEQYSRRQSCTGMMLVDTADVFVSEYTTDNDNVLEHFREENQSGENEFAVFSLAKRGRQHEYMGTVKAETPQGAINVFRIQHPNLFSFNIWVCSERSILRNNPEDREIWSTLSDKGYRDALADRAGDKLKNFLTKNE